LIVWLRGFLGPAADELDEDEDEEDEEENDDEDGDTDTDDHADVEVTWAQVADTRTFVITVPYHHLQQIHIFVHLTVKHTLLGCPTSAVIRHKYFSSTTLKELFSNNVDARFILDFTKESGFY